MIPVYRGVSTASVDNRHHAVRADLQSGSSKNLPWDLRSWFPLSETDEFEPREAPKPDPGVANLAHSKRIMLYRVPSTKIIKNL
jgi:hypothetical protein